MGKVTAKQLEAKRACSDQVRLFRETFLRGAALTAKNIRKAQAAGLSLDWWAENHLPASAWRAYGEAKASALIVALGLEDK